MDSATALQTIFTALPASVRKAIYKVVKILAAIVTLALLVLPAFPEVGINLPDSDRYFAIGTGLVTLLGHLADSNTNTDPLVDVNPAPEPGDPVPPEGVVDPAAAELVTPTPTVDQPTPTVDQPAPAAPTN